MVYNKYRKDMGYQLCNRLPTFSLLSVISLACVPSSLAWQLLWVWCHQMDWRVPKGRHLCCQINVNW